MVSGAGLSKNSVVTSEILEELPSEDWFALRMADDNLNDLLDTAKAKLEEQRQRLDTRLSDKRKKIEGGDDLAPGVLKIVKVYLAVKWLDVMVTRVSYQSSCLKRICLMMKMACL